MIIINKSDNIFEIIEKIEKYNEINNKINSFSSKIEKKIHKKFYKKLNTKIIELYVPENHDLLNTLSLLKILTEKFNKQKIIINSKGTISEKNIKLSKIEFICFKETIFQKFQKTKFYKNKILFFTSILFFISIFIYSGLFFIKNNHKTEIKHGEINLIFSEFPSNKEISLNPLITFTELNKNFLLINNKISPNNLKNFTKIYKKEIKEKAIYELSEITKFKAIEDGKKYFFINNPKLITIEKINIEKIDINKKNSSKIFFKGNVKAKGYFYDEEKILKKVKEKLDRKKISNIKLINKGKIFILKEKFIKFSQKIEFNYTIDL